ncbi:MAG: hypothetical protein B7Z78_12195 [Rhodospirillales bacterium 20-60-12]|nr:MAG: hypothetical protein B7Z78_12195 [Rhodospirillales bacterium 20-60-12]
MDGALRQSVRNAALKGFAALTGPIILRTVLGRWPAANERRKFREGFTQPYAQVPPLLRGIARLPPGQTQLNKLMLLSWLYGEHDPITMPPSPLGHLRRLGPDRPWELEHGMGDLFTAWNGPPLSFLHLEKTAGISLTAFLSAQFHPSQLDRDDWRTLPPHLVQRFGPHLDNHAGKSPLVWGHYDLPSLRRLDPERFVLTMLREPKARLVSLYHFWRSVDPRLISDDQGNFTVALAHKADLAGFLRTDDPFVRDYIDNFYVRRLTGYYVTGNDSDPLADDPQTSLNHAIAALDDIEFVGITEYMDESLVRLASCLGIAPPERAPRANVMERNADEDPAAFRAVSRQPISPEAQEALADLTRLDRVIYQRASAAYAGMPVIA